VGYVVKKEFGEYVDKSKKDHWGGSKVPWGSVKKEVSVIQTICMMRGDEKKGTVGGKQKSHKRRHHNIKSKS